jgi:hypothetical protein
VSACTSNDLVGTPFIEPIAPPDRPVVAALDRSGWLVPVAVRLACDGSPRVALGGCRLPNDSASLFLSPTIASAAPALRSISSRSTALSASRHGPMSSGAAS